MDTSEPVKSNLQTLAQRRFFQWAAKWYYAHELEDTSVKPDVSSLVMLLQAVGFQLRGFEKQEVKEENAPAKESIKMVINCGTSQMKAVLEMDGVECKCPSDLDETNGGSLWSVFGHAPSTNDSVSSFKYEKTGSSLLPTIPREENNVVRDVVYRLFKIMDTRTPITTGSTEQDIDVSIDKKVQSTPNFKKPEFPEGFSRSHTQPIISSIRLRPNNNQFPTPENLLRSKFNTDDARVPEIDKIEAGKRLMALQRQKTWDKDSENFTVPGSPRATISSNSADRLCSSLDQISITSEDEPVGFIDRVVKAYRHLDEAINFLARRAPLSSSTISIDDHSLLVPTPPGSALLSPNISRRGSTCSVPSRLSENILPAKPMNRRSIGTPISRISSELSSKKTISRDSLRPENSNSISGTQKLIPPRLTASRARAASTSSLATKTLNDKISLDKKRAVPDVKNNLSTVRKSSIGANTSHTARKSSLGANTPITARKSSLGANTPLTARKSSLGANTSLKAPNTSSKTSPQTSIKNPATKFGFTRK